MPPRPQVSPHKHSYLMAGNIVSNPGFIKQFGTIIAADGTVSLDPHLVSVWGGITSATILVGQQVGSIIADRFGRFPARILFTVVMWSAAFAEMFSTDWRGWLASKAVLGFGQGLIQATTLSVRTCTLQC